MSNPYLGRVNQQLIFARHQLQSRLDETNASDRMRNQGLLNAGIWHLRWAYRAYIAEVGANYKLQQPELPVDARSLGGALQAINKHPAEAQELLKLENEGFIAELLAALGSIEQVEAGLIPAPPSEQSDPLKLIDISQEPEKISYDFDDLANWIASFKELIDRHREHMIEY